MLVGWLAQHRDGVVIIDVLAKVRPAGGKGNAYDEDYNALRPLKQIVQWYPDAVILIVTHDRKAGSDDWMTRITGTRGVSGSVDYNLFIDRKRGDSTGRIEMAGRDLADDVLPVRLDGTHWEVATLDDVMASPTVSTTRQQLYAWLSANGPARAKAIAAGTGLGFAVVRNRLRDMVRDGQVFDTVLGYATAPESDDQ